MIKFLTNVVINNVTKKQETEFMATFTRHIKSTLNSTADFCVVVCI